MSHRNLDCPDLDSTPHQLRSITFPKVSLVDQRYFLVLVGLISRDSCIGTRLLNVLSLCMYLQAEKAQMSYSWFSRGYQNVTSGLWNNESSACYKEAVEKMPTESPQTLSVTQHCLDSIKTHTMRSVHLPLLPVWVEQDHFHEPFTSRQASTRLPVRMG